MYEILKIRASDFAKFTGHNKFVTNEEAVTLFWQRNRKVAEKRGISIEAEMNEIERDFRQRSVLAQTAIKESLCLPLDAPIESVVRTVEDKLVTSIAHVETTTHMIAKLDVLPEELRDTIGREAQKMRGTFRENASIDKIEQETGRSVSRRNTQYFQKVLPIYRTDLRIKIVGMLDGRFDDDGGIVETKERRSRLFGCVVPYELLQLHCYMFLTETNKATLVERFDDQSERYEVIFDDTFWKDALKRFEFFLENHVPHI